MCMDATTSPLSPSVQTNAAPYRWRFKLRTLLLLIAAASIGLAAMRYATAAWSCAVASATVISVFGAAVLAWCIPRERRPFWIGFVIFSGGYLVVAAGFGQYSTWIDVPTPYGVATEGD